MDKKIFLRTLLFSTACTMLIQGKTWAAEVIEVGDAPRSLRQATISFSPRGALGIDKTPPIEEFKEDLANAQKELRAFFATAHDYGVGHPTLGVLHNMFYVAITGQRGADILYERSNHKKPKMGLQILRHSQVTQKKSVVAQNYLV